MRMIGRIAVLVLALGGSAAWAGAPENDIGMRQNCAGDYFRFCASYMPGTMGIRRCFGSNMPKLTPECRAAIQAYDRGAGKTPS